MGASSPNPLAARPANPAVTKAKALSTLNNDESSTTTSRASTPGLSESEERDLAEDLNAQVRAQYVKGQSRTFHYMTIAPWELRRNFGFLGKMNSLKECS
jgi:hypothetical protein